MYVYTCERGVEDVRKETKDIQACQMTNVGVKKCHRSLNGSHRQSDKANHSMGGGGGGVSIYKRFTVYCI